jgi:hypothetical protein
MAMAANTGPLLPRESQAVTTDNSRRSFAPASPAAAGTRQIRLLRKAAAMTNQAAPVSHAYY